MVQMISESKRKIAALALAGAMAIGGAAGVAKTIASPAQNQSGIVMEAEAATVKPENIKSAIAGNVIKNKAYNVYYDTGFSSQYKIRFNPSLYEYTNKSALKPKVVASNGTLKDLSTEGLYFDTVTDNGTCYVIRSTNTAAYKTVKVRFFGHKKGEATNDSSYYGYNDVTLHVINRSKIKVKYKTSASTNNEGYRFKVKFVPYYDSNGLTDETSDDVAIPNCTITTYAVNNSKKDLYKQWGYSDSQAVEKSKTKTKSLRARCAAGEVLTVSEGDTWTYTEMNPGKWVFYFKVGNTTISTVTRQLGTNAEIARYLNSIS